MSGSEDELGGYDDPGAHSGPLMLELFFEEIGYVGLTVVNLDDVGELVLIRFDSVLYLFPGGL